MTTTHEDILYRRARKCKFDLCKQYVDPIQDVLIRKLNNRKIEWTIENVLTPQLFNNNEGERQVLEILKEHHFEIKTQCPVILLDGDKITHIYIADFLIDDKIIVEVDGSVHHNTLKHDEERDILTMKAGYITIRIPRTDNEYNVELIVNSILEYANDTHNNNINREISKCKQEISNLENSIRILKSQYV